MHSGPQHSRFSPKAISLTFMSSDFIALVLQAAGGAIADTAPTQKGSQAGTHIMVAGLSFQVLSLLCFIAVASEFFVNVRKAGKSEDAGSGSSPDAEQEQSNAAKWNVHAYKHFIAGMSYILLWNEKLKIISTCPLNTVCPHSLHLPCCGAVQGLRQQASERRDTVHDS